MFPVPPITRVPELPDSAVMNAMESAAHEPNLSLSTKKTASLLGDIIPAAFAARASMAAASCLVICALGSNSLFPRPLTIPSALAARMYSLEVSVKVLGFSLIFFDLRYSCRFISFFLQSMFMMRVQNSSRVMLSR